MYQFVCCRFYSVSVIVGVVIVFNTDFGLAISGVWDNTGHLVCVCGGGRLQNANSCKESIACMYLQLHTV